MKRILNLFILISLLIFSGCENLQNPQLPGGEAKIATSQEQIDAIKASLPKLKSTLNSLNSLTAETQERSAMAMTKASSNGNINNIKEYILALEERIEALEAYVNSDQSGDWTETTYATIEMYEETIGILAYIQCEIDALKGSLESAKEQICKDVTKGINEACASMKTWVNEQLSGYYDIAATDAMLAKLQESLTAEDESVRKEIDALRSDLAEQLDDMTADYKSAIKSAIEENNGILTAKLEKRIQDVNARIDSAIEEMDKRMKDIEDRLSKLEGTVEELLNRIQTMVYIPIYEDGHARVNFPNTDTSEGRLTLDFKISPKNAVTDLVKASRDGDVVTIQALYTGSPIAVDLPVVECHADEKQGVFSVTVACDNLNMDFYNGEKNARAILYISDGNNDKSSDYIPLTPNLTHVSNNQIWYTVTGKLQVDIEIGEGPKIVTHAYDEAKGCYVVNFDEAISTIRSSYFAGKSEVKTVSLPNSITTIEDSAFKGCNNLSQISLGNSVVSIGANTFRECALTRVDLPATLRTLGADAFDYSEIQSFTGKSVAEDGLTIILEDRIKAVALGGIQDGRYSVPASVTSIEKDVFKNCTKINEVDIEDIQAWYNIDFEGQFSNPLHNGAILKSGDEEVSDITFPETMTKVKPYSFCGCTSLRSVTLHNKIQTVGISAFMGCENLSVLSMQSATAPKLGSNVFEGCETLKIYIPDQEDAVRSYLSCDWYDLYKHIVIWNIGDFPKTHCIEYTTSDNKPVQFSAENLHSHTYENGKGIITFTVPCTSFKGFDSGAERILTCALPESVSVIGTGAFSGCSSMTSFEIPEAVTAINASTFKGCGSLSEITVPENIEVIGASAFENCVSLAGFAFPNKVTAINNSTFAGCVKLNDVVIHKDITNIGASAFAGCTGLTSLEFESATPPAVQPTAFDSCNNLKITIPTEEASLKAYLASGWSNATLQKVPYLLDPANLPSGYWLEYTTTDNQPVQFKDSNIFYSCYLNNKGFALSRNQINSFGGFTSGAERILTCLLPKNVTKIESGAFKGCQSLTSFEIPESVTSISSNTFAGCTGLEAFAIPEQIRSIGRGAFVGCTLLTSITFLGGVPPTVSTGAFDAALAQINVPAAAEEDYMGCSWDIGYRRLLNISAYPESHIIRYKTVNNATLAVTEALDKYLLKNDYENTEGVLILDKPVKAIPDNAFVNCAYLSEITFPSALEYVGYQAFYQCNTLKSVAFPEGLQEIGESAFREIRNLETVTLCDGIKKIGNAAFYSCPKLSSINFPDGLLEIGDFAFASCGKLNTIELPSSLVLLGESAFQDCGLTQIAIPGGIQSLEPCVFAGNNFTSVVVPDNIKSIGASAFVYCHELTEITIPSSVTSMGERVFNYCDRLRRVNIASILSWINIAFSGPCFERFGATEGSASLYVNGQRIHSFNVPNTVERISDFAFCNISITEVTIPQSVKTIGHQAFAQCNSLTRVTCNAQIPPELGNDVFSWSYNLKIYVPGNLLDLYKATPDWSQYANRIFEAKPLEAVNL